MKTKKSLSSLAGKITFIGAGKMAEALIKGLIEQKFPAKKIMASDISDKRLRHLKKEYKIKISGNNGKAADFGDIIILAVKPQAMGEVILRLSLNPNKLVISIAAGIPTESLAKTFKNNPIIRVMPNNPALIGEGISAICRGPKVKKQQLDLSARIFQAVGEIVEVPEALMDAVTGLSGSGPAFVYLFAEAMLEAGEALKFKRDIAEKLAVQTILGSALTLKRSGRPAKELREMVTSPKGTTEEGLKVLEETGFKQALKRAVLAATQRAEALSKSI